MPRVLKRHLPPEQLWPPPEDASEDQVVMQVASPPDEHGRQDVWIRWHAGDLRHAKRQGWQVELVPGADLRYLEAYWKMTGLAVAVSMTP